jgi:hypothetical protein
MSKMKVSGLLAASLLVLIGCSGKPLATVNGKKITLKEFEQQVQTYQGMRQNQPVDRETRQAILTQMVKQELLVQEAGKLGLDKKTELKARILEQANQYREELKTRIAMEQSQLGQIDKAVRSRVLIEELLSVKAKEYGINEKQVHAYYDDLKKKGQAGSLPPFEQVWESVRQQMVLDRVSDEAKEKNDVQVFMERLPAATGEAGVPMAFPPEKLPPAAAKK